MKKALRTMAVGLALTMSLSAFVACSGNNNSESGTTSASPAASTEASTAPSANPKGTIKALTYMTGTDSFTKTWQDAIKGFQAKYPDVTVEDESVPAPNDVFKNKINTDFASGNEPDIAFGFTGADGDPVVKSGKVMAWDDELKNDAAWGGNFYPDALEAVRADDGKIYGLPYIGYYEGVFYNQEAFDKAGVKYPITTWDDFMKAIDTFNAKGITPIACSFAEEPHYLIETMILKEGGLDGHKKLWDASWTKGLNDIKTLYEKKAFSADALTIKSAAANQLFIDGKAAMLVQGSWAAGGFKTDKVDMTGKSGIMPMPVPTGGAGEATSIINGFGSGWYVSTEKNKTSNGAGVAFAKYLTTPEVAKTFITVGGTPALKGSESSSATPVQKSGYDMIANAKGSDKPIDNRIKPAAFKTIWTNLGAIAKGTKTAEQILKDAEGLNK